MSADGYRIIARVTASIGALVVGMAVGMALRDRGMPDGQSIDPIQAAGPSMVEGSDARPHAGRVRLEQLRQQSNLLDRRRHLLQLTSQATAARCRELLIQCQDDEQASLQIVARWAELDPKGLHTFLVEDKIGMELAESDAVLRALFAAWAKSDPDGALSASRQTPSFELRNRCLTQLVGNLLYLDPEAAVTMVQGLHAQEEEVLGQFREFADWSGTDHAGAAALLATLPLSKFRMRMATDLTRRWGETDPMAAIRFAEQLDPQARELAIETAVAGWMKSDVESAKAYIEAADGTTRARLGRQLVTQMAQDDPGAAFAWIDAHLEGRARNQSITKLIEEGSSDHPDAMAKIADELPPGDLKQTAVKTLAHAWFESDHRAAVEWLTNIEPGFALEAGLEGMRLARLPEQLRSAIVEEIDDRESP